MPKPKRGADAAAGWELAAGGAELACKAGVDRPKDCPKAGCDAGVAVPNPPCAADEKLKAGVPPPKSEAEEAAAGVETAADDWPKGWEPNAFPEEPKLNAELLAEGAPKGFEGAPKPEAGVEGAPKAPNAEEEAPESLYRSVMHHFSNGVCDLPGMTAECLTLWAVLSLIRYTGKKPKAVSRWVMCHGEPEVMTVIIIRPSVGHLD